MNRIPRAEYPRPQFVRPTWMNLNGQWQFEIDQGASGRSRGLVNRALNGEITVPFCPESELSGVNNKDFMAAVWYRRSFTLPEEAAGKRVLLHFGAVDYRCEAWVNGKSVGVHEGGYVSFTFDITDALQPGENVLVVCADDNQRGGRQPYGKQSPRYESFGCSYTRTTGIWQTVWLEKVPANYITYYNVYPDVDNCSVHLRVGTCGSGTQRPVPRLQRNHGNQRGLCHCIAVVHARGTARARASRDRGRINGGYHSISRHHHYRDNRSGQRIRGD